MEQLKDCKVIVFTSAYNVENVLGKTIQSVLNQTHANFEYYLFDNASTDGTWDVISEYARKDKRIVPHRFDFNRFGRALDFVLSIEDFSAKRYFVILDSDDEYVPHAFELMLKTMHETGACIVGSNSCFIDMETGEPKDTFTAENDLIIEGGDFALLFPQYHKYMRTVWGKMYDLYKMQIQGELADAYTYLPPNVSNSFTSQMFYMSKKVVILKDKLYRYYIRPESVSRTYFSNKFKTIKTSIKKSHTYLTEKIGMVSAENKRFIMHDAFKQICLCVPLVLSASIELSVKLRELVEIFSDEIVRDIYGMADFADEKYALLNSVRTWLSAQEIKAGSEESTPAAELETYLTNR